MAQVSAAQGNALLNELVRVAKFDSKLDKITLVDDVSETNITYVGVAKRPAKGSDAAWFITKIDEDATNPIFPTTNITILTSEPNVIWDNRLFLPYNAEKFDTFDTTFDETFG